MTYQAVPLSARIKREGQTRGCFRVGLAQMRGEDLDAKRPLRLVRELQNRRESVAQFLCRKHAQPRAEPLLVFESGSSLDERLINTLTALLCKLVTRRRRSGRGIYRLQ